MCWILNSSKLSDYDGSIAVGWRGQLAKNLSLFQMPLHRLTFFDTTPPSALRCFRQSFHCRTQYHRFPRQLPSLLSQPRNSILEIYEKSYDRGAITSNNNPPPFAYDTTQPITAGYDYGEGAGLHYCCYWPCWTVIMVRCTELLLTRSPTCTGSGVTVNVICYRAA